MTSMVYNQKSDQRMSRVMPQETQPCQNYSVLLMRIAPTLFTYLLTRSSVFTDICSKTLQVKV